MKLQKSLNACMCALSLSLIYACSPSETASTPSTSEAVSSQLKLYTMSCGEIAISDLGAFSTNGEFDGQSRTFSDSCYLIRHAKGDLMWDAGIPDAMAMPEEGTTNGVFHVTVPRTLASQLTEIEVSPDDVEYFAMSHAHFDHTGNANMFAGSTWLVDGVERDWMFDQGPATGLTQLETYAELQTSETITFSDDYDVFGDGSVQIIRTPGHTPGHLALLVKLPETGNLLLTGDLYHMPLSREFRRIPTFNTSAEDTLVSMDKFEALAKAENARVIIQHAKEDVASLPSFPAYAD